MFGGRAAGEVIIDYDEVGPSVGVKPKHVEADGEVVVLEDVDDLLGVAGVFCDCCQAVADAQLALLDVVGVDAVEELKVAV